MNASGGSGAPSQQAQTFSCREGAPDPPRNHSHLQKPTNNLAMPQQRHPKVLGAFRALGRVRD